MQAHARLILSYLTLAKTNFYRILFFEFPTRKLPRVSREIVFEIQVASLTEEYYLIFSSFTNVKYYFGQKKWEMFSEMENGFSRKRDVTLRKQYIF